MDAIFDVDVKNKTFTFEYMAKIEYIKKAIVAIFHQINT
jgi:hypothetical protein